MVQFIRSDLEFILAQIMIAEQHAAGDDLRALLPNSEVAFGLRTVDGSLNNLVPGQSEFGAADNVFPRLTDPVFRAAEAGTSYLQTSGLVVDSQPRTISNLLVDQTMNNPAAIAAALRTAGSQDIAGDTAAVLAAVQAVEDAVTPEEQAAAEDALAVLAGGLGLNVVTSPGLDGQFGTGDDAPVLFIPNVAPDEGLSAGFNAWMTFFGQFFDHGLDLVSKGGSGTIFMPLQPDDPLFDPASPTNFLVLTRATNQPGADGILGTADDVHEHTNTTSPFVDQNQTYSSHPSHQVFLRAYAFNTAGDPVSTGRLITNRNLGSDGIFGTEDDVEIGGMATWAVLKAQARDLLGINLTDADFNNVPLLATDAYGNFIPGLNGFPQVVMKGADGIAGTADDVLVEGDPEAPLDLTNAVRTGHAFLDDIAHSAVPKFVDGALTPDSDAVVGLSEAGAYDDELLDAHYMAGDGRVNENIGLTTVHHVFHSEHNRLVEHTKDVALATNDLAFLSEWLVAGTAPATFPVTQDEIDALQWNGERLFQAAKFGTEMQYQHLVFEEFARTIQPQIDVFIGPTQGYDANINPSIVAEFAHTVYRFGHSMLTETIDRLDPDFQNSEIGLIAAFLNPLAFADSGPTPEQAAGAIVRGTTRQLGNEIDEFVTEALRNNLLGLPLDLATINLARGRDAGVPSLNAARREFYQGTGDSQLKPYTSWADFVQHLKHPESLINFIAAYGTHISITSATTLDDKRAAASLLVLGGVGEPADRLDFLNSTGAWASGPAGVTITGLDDVDLWIGGLAEEKMPFGGMLGSTFNFVFETQLEALQNGDRFYYLDRTAGLNFVTELENNSFAKLIMANSGASHLPGLVFQKPGFILEIDPTKQFTGLDEPGADGTQGTTDDELGPDGIAGNSDPIGDSLLTPLVIRDNPATLGPDLNYLQYTGDDHVVLGGTEADDILISSIGDDTIWGDGGNDRIDAGDGNDLVRAGAGDDIITDLGGDDNIQGDDGNDVIQGGNGINLILGGFGSDFIVTGEDSSEAFGGTGNDFILGANANEQDMGNEGDDWLEQGNLDGNPGDNFDPFGLDTIIGNDVYIGSGQTDIMNAEGGDDIMVGSSGPGDKFLGASGFDWATFKDDEFGVNVDLTLRAFDAAPLPASSAAVLARFAEVEGLSGSALSDILRGDDADAVVIATAGAQGSVLTNVGLIDGLQDFLGAGVTSFGAGNIILGGDGSDIIEGRGGDDLIDGDAWLNVRISVRANANGTGDEIATFESMVPLIPLMLAGTYNPGQLTIARELLYADGPDFDSAAFSGALADYTFAVDGVVTEAADLDGIGLGHVIRVTDNVGTDGTDTVRNIERLQFSDQSVVLGGLNSGPAGLLTILDAATNTPDDTPDENQLLRVSIANVTDADNSGGVITGPVTFFWQFEPRPGTGVFEDILVLAGGEQARVTGETFRPGDAEAGLRLRVRAVYQDANGVLEEVLSAPTAAVKNSNDAPVGTVTISDASPTETLSLSASNAFTDADGLTTAVFTYQWQQSAVGGGGTFTDITGANTQLFTPGQAEVNRQLRVVVSYTDDQGTLETVVASPTAVVGDFIPGNGAAQVLTGNAGDDLIFGGGGNDIINSNGGNDTIDGGSGLDTINAGAGNDTINYTMGGGSDQVTGGADTDTLNIVGLAGNDILDVVFNGTTITSVEGGAITGVEEFTASLAGGSNTLSYGATSVPVTVNLASGFASGLATISDIQNVTGGGGNDALTSGVGLNVLNGGGGNDTFFATTGDGDDNYSGGGGNDTYDLSATSDGVSINTAAAIGVATGNDLLSSIENIIGSQGNDTIVFNGGINVLDGQGGDDTISAGASNDAVRGGSGDDVLNGDAGNDTLDGEAGNDTLVGGANNDILIGGLGADTFLYTVGDGVDSVSGGDGFDILSILGTGATNALDVTWNGTVLSNFEGGGTILGIEQVSADLLGGTDILSYAGSTVGVEVDLGAGTASGFSSIAGIENVTGGSGADVLTGDAGANVLAGGVGNDTYHVGSGDLVAETAGGGTDTVFSSADFTLGGNLEDLTFEGIGPFSGTGNGLANVITGSATDSNALTGNGGNDRLIGGAEVDSLNGGIGNDTLVGGGGNDVMNGGANLDTFVFGPGFGADVVSGFDANPGGGGQDLLDVTGLGITADNFAALVTITDLGTNTQVIIGGPDGGTIMLLGVNGAASNIITQQDFLLL